MRKLVLILVASIAVITFIRAFDFSSGGYSENIHSDELLTGETLPLVVE